LTHPLGAVDQVVVGFLEAGAVAGVGLSNGLSFIGILVYSAIGTGSGVLIAQAHGRKNMEEVSATRPVSKAWGVRRRWQWNFG
jgi:Na+-driven multidrug efflux pump